MSTLVESRVTGRPGVAALALLPLALLLATALLRTPDLPQRFPDSSSYLLWQPERSIGYPALLSTVRTFDPSLRALPLVQLALFAGAALLLAEACRYATGSLWLALFVGGFTLANVPLARFALGVLSDAPFCALLMLHLASLLAVIKRPSAVRWLAVSLTLAGAVLVRPAGLSLLVPLSLVLLRQPRRALFPALVPAAALWLFAATINLVWRGTFALQEFAGTSLLLHVDPLIEARTDGKHPQLVRRMAEDLRPWREELARRRWPEEAVLFSAVEWGPMFAFASRRLAEHLDERGAESLGLSGLPRVAALNRIAGDVARETILARPGRYLAHVAAHLYGLWTIPQWVSASELARIESRFDELYPGAARLAGHRERYLSFLSARGTTFLLVERLVLSALFVASVAGLLLPLRRSEDAAAPAWLYASWGLHAGLLLVAATNVAHWRYSVVWWPYGLLSVGLALRWLGRVVAHRRGARRA